MSIAVFSAQQTQQLFDLFSAMTDYYAGDPARINHFVASYYQYFHGYSS